MHVAHHWKSPAGVLRVPTDAQEVRDRRETGDGAGTVQEAQSCIEGDHRRGQGRRGMGSAIACPKSCQNGGIAIHEGPCGVVKEMKASRKRSERIRQDALEVSYAMLSQMMALVDLVELVVQGKCFVRTCEMGRPESDGEELPTRWSRKGKGKAKEDESEEEPEVEEEAEEKDEPEDVNMTLC